MAYSVELNLTEPGAALVFDLWTRLAEQAINSEMLDVGVKPHLSLAVYEELDPASIRDDLAHFAEGTQPFSVILASVGTFPTGGVVFIAPVVTRELLRIHETFHSQVGDKGLDCQSYYLPGRWVPHCTVATNVPSDKMGQAVDVCLRYGAFEVVDIGNLSLVEFRPVREIYNYDLGGV